MVSWKTKHALTIQSSCSTPLYLPKKAENSCPNKNLHEGVHSNFIQYFHNLEATKISFSRRMNKQSGIYSDNEIFSALKRNELSGHEKTQRKLKYVLLSERSLYEKAAYCMIPIM